MDPIVVTGVTVALILLAIAWKERPKSDFDPHAVIKAEARSEMFAGTLNRQAAKAEELRHDFRRIAAANHLVEAVDDALRYSGRRQRGAADREKR